MSRFRILRVDDPDPAGMGKRNRFIFTVYGALPTLFILAVNLGAMNSKYHNLIYYSSLPLLAVILVLLIRNIRKNIKGMKTIGELEITRSGLKKRISDSTTDYNFQSVKELSLTKHMPGTRFREAKSQYFSYILKIEMNDGAVESMVVSDRSSDFGNKLSIAETMKTLKKIVPFEVHLDI